jgi:5-methylcytosine-specific restriction enzyme A
MNKNRIDRTTPFNEKGKCNWCNKTLAGKQIRWCSNKCQKEYLIRVSPSFVRGKVYQRDKGICSLCGVDTCYVTRIGSILKSVIGLEFLRAEREILNYVSKYPHGAHRANIYEQLHKELHEIKKHLLYFFYDGYKFSQKYLEDYGKWEADHIIPVVEGGGGCDLDNYRTLCRSCHKGETKKLRARLKENKTKQPSLN